MRITDIEPVVIRVNMRGDWVFVLVHTDAGLTGLGEASHSGNDVLLLHTLEVLRTALIGRSPLEMNGIWQSLARVDGGRIAHTALSGVEQALWDLVGQHLGVPIHALFGGAVRDRVRLYANINRAVQDRSPEGFARAARQAVEEGYTAVKLAPFDELRQPDHQRTGPQAAWRPGVARVEAVRTAVGEDVDLMVDCHGRMEPSEAVTVGQALGTCGLMWYEEPVSHTYPEHLAYVTSRVSMPTASAESLFAMEGFRPFLTQRVVDVLMPDVKHCGGLREMGAIAQAARLHNLLIAPHNPSGPVATLATAHAAAVMSNFLILEIAWGEVDWRGSLLLPEESIRGGYLQVPTSPGLGARLNPEVVESHRRTMPEASDSSRVWF